MTLGRNTEGRDLRTRLLIVGAVFGLGLLVLAINLYRLMVVRYDEFFALSKDNQYKDVRVRAARGEIRDRRGEVLVDGRPSFDVFVTPAFCLKCTTEVLPVLGDWLGWDETKRARVERSFTAAHGPQRYQPMAVQIDLSRDQLDFLSVRLFQLAGVTIEPIARRNYRTGSAMAHVLGYMSEVTQEELNVVNGTNGSAYFLGDARGRRGVEREFESALRGSDGLRKEVVDARGKVVLDEATGQVMSNDVSAPVPGNNLVLSIDARLQAEAENVFPGKAGALIALDPQTGFIRAIVSRPAFDSNLLSRAGDGRTNGGFCCRPAAADGVSRRCRALPPGLDVQANYPARRVTVGLFYAPYRDLLPGWLPARQSGVALSQRIGPRPRRRTRRDAKELRHLFLPRSRHHRHRPHR